MKFKFQEVFFAVFSTLWVVILIIDYLDKHPIYWLSLVHYKYFGLTIFWLLLGIPFALLYSRSLVFKRIQRPFLNGLMVYGLFIILLLSTVFAFNQYIMADLNISHYSHVVIRSSYTLLCGGLVSLGAYSAGNLVLKSSMGKIQLMGISRFLVETSIGFAIIIFGLFVLGIFGLLKQWIVLGWLLFFSLVNYKHAIATLNIVLWKRFDLPKSWNFWGYFVIFLILVYSAINFLYTQAPFPLGFDARNYYVKISKLVAESEALISGFQPYAWSLLDSVGYIAFLSSEVTLFLATIGGYFTMLGIYEIGTKYLNLNTNYLLLACLLFMSTPAVTNHWIIEFKVDLALLFVQFSILCLLFHWLTFIKVRGDKLLSSRTDLTIFFILSTLLGFTMSIKVLSIFLIFGVFIVLWWYSKDNIGLIGTVLFTFGIIIYAKLDEFSGLRIYHHDPNRFAVICLLCAGALFTLSIFFKPKVFLNNAVALLFSLLVIFVTFSPWIIKNYSDSNSDGLNMKLIIGNEKSLEVNYGSIVKNYENYQKNK